MAEAQAEGERWASSLRGALLQLHVGADFGERTPQSGLTAHGLALLAQQGGRVLNEVHGLQVFETDPMPLFASASADLQVITSAAKTEGLLRTAALHSVNMSPESQVAHDLFSASQATRGDDARFLLLMMALEALLAPSPRPAESVELVDRLIAQVESSGMPRRERDSLNGALRWLRHESISQAGRRLVSKLGPQSYAGRDPVKLFTESYKLRSALAHGHVPRPSRSDVTGLLPPLERMVADIVKVSLGLPPTMCDGPAVTGA